MIKSTNVKGFEEFNGNLDNLFHATMEKVRMQILENGLRVPESTLHSSSRKSSVFHLNLMI